MEKMLNMWKGYEFVYFMSWLIL